MAEHSIYPVSDSINFLSDYKLVLITYFCFYHFAIFSMETVAAHCIDLISAHCFFSRSMEFAWYKIFLFNDSLGLPNVHFKLFLKKAWQVFLTTGIIETRWFLFSCFSERYLKQYTKQ